eukprot:1161966-Pelagomonas_calceolata.AAC.16
MPSTPKNNSSSVTHPTIFLNKGLSKQKKDKRGSNGEYNAISHMASPINSKLPGMAPQNCHLLKHWVKEGSVEDEHMFSAMKYLRNLKRNSLKEQHLTAYAWRRSRARSLASHDALCVIPLPSSHWEMARC